MGVKKVKNLPNYSDVMFISDSEPAEKLLAKD